MYYDGKSLVVYVSCKKIIKMLRKYQIKNIQMLRDILIQKQLPKGVL